MGDVIINMLDYDNIYRLNKIIIANSFQSVVNFRTILPFKSDIIKI